MAKTQPGKQTRTASPQKTGSTRGATKSAGAKTTRKTTGTK